jgi:hypothetical protein
MNTEKRAIVLLIVAVSITLSACSAGELPRPISTLPTTPMPTGTPVITLAPTARPTRTPTPTLTFTPIPPTLTATLAPTRVFVPSKGTPYGKWAWPGKAITVWYGNQELNRCDSGRVWYCDPQWNPNMKSPPPDLRVYNDSWHYGGKVDSVPDEITTLSFRFSQPAKDVVLNVVGNILIDQIIGILPTGERVPLGYAWSDGKLVPTKTFMDTDGFNVDWLTEYEIHGGYPGSNPCGFVGLQPDGSYTLASGRSSLVLRLLQAPPLDAMTMGVSAYSLAGIDLVVKGYAGGAYSTCSN